MVLELYLFAAWSIHIKSQKAYPNINAYFGWWVIELNNRIINNSQFAILLYLFLNWCILLSPGTSSHRSWSQLKTCSQAHSGIAARNILLWGNYRERERAGVGKPSTLQGLQNLVKRRMINGKEYTGFKSWLIYADFLSKNLEWVLLYKICFLFHEKVRKREK